MKKCYFVVMAVGLLAAVGIHVGNDVSSFNSIMSSSYKTPWYSGSWVKQPYTTFKLAGSQYSEYWTKNAVGDDWYVRDTYHQGKTFWTIVKGFEG